MKHMTISLGNQDKLQMDLLSKLHLMEVLHTFIALVPTMAKKL